MSVLAYLIRCYIYIAKIICPSTFTNFKHKNSLELYSSTTLDSSYNEVGYCDDSNNTSENYLHISSKNKLPPSLKINKTYNCGHCNRPIKIPQYMYSDKIYCSIQCRHEVILYDKNMESHHPIH